MIGKNVKHFTGAADKDVKWWFAQLDRGINRRKKEEKLWDKNENFARLKQWHDDYGVGDQVTVNKLGSFMRTHRASVCYRNPRVKMIPRQPAGYQSVVVPEIGSDGQPVVDPQTGMPVLREVTRAKARENLINDIISQPLFGLTEMISRVDKAGILAYAAASAGYRPKFETPPEKNADGKYEVMIGDDGMPDFISSGFVPDPVNPQMPLLVDDEPVLKAEVPVWEDWFIDWVSYRNIIIDPDGENDFMQHRWVAMEVVRRLDEVKNDPLFENTEDLEGGGEYDGDDRDELRFSEWMGEEIDQDKAKCVRLFHIWDFVNDEYLVLADGHKKFLRRTGDHEEAPGLASHSPLAFLRYDEIPGEFYPLPIASDLALINQWYNEARRLELIGMKNSIRKVFVPKGLLQPEDIEKLESDEDMQVVLFDNSQHLFGRPVAEVFTPPMVNGSIYQAAASASGDFDEIAGSPEMRGKASADTATQSNNLRAGESLRVEYERTLMRNFLIDIFKKLNDSIDANMTIPRAIQITGSDGQAFVGLVDRDMIAGDFDIDIDVQEMAPRDDMALGAQRIQLVQMAGSYPHQFSDITRARGWCEMFGIADENFIKSLVEGAQMQIQMAMIEAQPPVPNAAPPGDAAQAASQSGAGMQIPAMQGAK